MQEVELKYILFCDFAQQTLEGKQNILGTFNQLSHEGDSRPIILPSCYLVISLTGKSNSTHKFKLISTAKPREIIFPFEAEIKLTITGEYVFQMGLTNIVFDDPGNYDFVVLIDGKEVGRATIAVLNFAQPKQLESKQHKSIN